MKTPNTAASAEREAPADLPLNHFIRGAQACREMMARFVAATHPEIAQSIRLNWHPGWDGDPGTPDRVIETWEPVACPDGEKIRAALEAEDRAAVEADELNLTLKMLETWAPIVEPAAPNGQVSFTRAIMDSAATALRLSAPPVKAGGVEPVAWTGSGSLDRIRGKGSGFQGYIYGTKDDAHPIALYTSPAGSGAGLVEADE